ncbi:MAG TPA: (d)CMP kinase [Syntrophales bacterium]|nr:(d)CMP kinase [Syntrophales bacterium]
MQKKAPIVTIDGPAGSGKSTIAKAVAWRLSFAYLDTGALYRAVAVELRRRHLSPEDDEGLSKLFSETAISLVRDGTEQRVQVNGRDVTGELRSEAISLLASRISAKPAVRAFLIDIQRGCGRSGRLVAEGRDMGTVVFPEANIKFFLDASAEERARRRYRELRAKGEAVDYDEILKDLIFRDRQDRERVHAPLRAAPDAVVIDTTRLGIDEVAEAILGVIRGRLEGDEAL